MSFERILNPRAVAIIGASADLTRIGGHPIKALKKAGFTGGIHPVNPKYREIAGFACHPTAAAIGTPVDLAIIAVPAAQVPEAIRDCGRAGIAGAVVLTAGFRETGAKGRALEDELLAVARETGVRVVGPNCQGLLSIQSRVWAVFGSVAEETELKPGRVSCAFQSGGFGYAIVNLAELQGLGFRYCVSTGNETDVSMPELIDAFLDDPGTGMVFGYLEGTSDARRLLDVGAKSLALGKPVLLWKGAQSDAGERAAASHTASMTGSYDLYRGAFRQSGIIEVHDVEEIVDLAKVAGPGRLPEGDGVGVLSISGGSGIVFADRAVREGLALPQFTPETLAALNEIIPAFGSINNPADVTAGVFNDLSLITRTVEIVLKDPGVHQLAILLASIPGPPALRAAEAIVAAARTTTKPVAVGWSGRRAKSEEAYAMLEAGDVPVVPTPVRLADAMARLAQFARAKRRHAARAGVRAASAPARQVAVPARVGALSEVESKALLEAFGVPFPRSLMVRRGEEPVRVAGHLVAPYAVKVVSRDIAHKTEAGGVKLNVDRAHLHAAVEEVIGNGQRHVPGAVIEGALVAEMASGVEVLIGVVNDPAFGPAVALGLGGVLTELLHDVVHAIAPVDRATALDMIAELKGAKLLDGYRGAPPADREALADLVVTVSNAAVALGNRLQELDLNPVFVRQRGRGVVAADALVVLR